MTVTGFSDDGIDTNGTGALVSLEGVDLTDNGGFGLRAGGNVNIEGTEQRQSLIVGNGKGGVLLEQEGTIKFADLDENGGPGITAEGAVNLIGARITNNAAEGFLFHDASGSCGTRQLSIRPPDSPTAPIRYSTISGNTGAGVFVGTGGVNVDPGTTISDNRGPGLVLLCGALGLGDVERPGSVPVTIARNGSQQAQGEGGACYTSDPNQDYALVETSCVGGGMILLAENRLQKSAIDDVLVADNRR